MPEDTVPPVDKYETSIRRFLDAQTRLNKTRLRISLFIMLIFAVYLTLIYKTFADFRDNRLPEFSAELSTEAAQFMPRVTNDVRAMTDRLVPFYINTFSAQFANDEEIFSAVIVEEFDQLESFSAQSWIKIEEALAQLVVEQEEAATAALSGILSSEDMAKVSAAYHKALTNKMEAVMSQHFEAQISLGEDIIENLHTLTQVEPDVPIDDTQYIFGMLMELLGLEMQKQSEFQEIVIQ